jgi:phage terminase large subunit-like protein
MTPAPLPTPEEFLKGADKYARDVVAGRVVACRWVKLACQRHLDDLKKSKAKGYPYRYDGARAAKVCKFVSLLHHTKGKWAAKSERIKLEPWQLFLTCVIFGWVHKAATEEGLHVRRFRRVFLLIPRKNGKSLLAAAWGLYMFCADKEHGAEVYSGATSEKQAWEVFRPARLMAKKNPKLTAFFGVEVNASNIHVPANESRFEPIIGNPGDGASPSCAIHDEYHEHDTDAQVDAMRTGMGAREQPLQIIVTTAGDNLGGPCYALQQDVQQVLEGIAENDELFGCIWTVDKGDDWSTEDALRKANPNYGVSVFADFLKGQLAEARLSPRKAGIFQTKHLNVWVQAREPYFNTIAWREARNDHLSLVQFPGASVVVTLDLASKIDIAAMTILLKYSDEQAKARNKRYAMFNRYYLPEDTVAMPENEKYRSWEAEGYLITTPGNMIDIDRIKDDLLDLAGFLQVELVGADPWQATQLITQLQAEGVPVVEYRQTVQNFSEPMKEFDALIRGGLIDHDGDPVTLWMLSNVVGRVDAKDNVYPRKERAENKIDGAVSGIMAMGLLLHGVPDARSVYEERGLAEVVT